jgi:hypothetical protein
MSVLAWRDGRARLLVPFKRDHRRHVVLYSLDRGTWTATLNDFGLLSFVALRLTPERDLLAVVRAIEDSIPDGNSLFLYEKRPSENAWKEKRLIVRSGQEPVLDPVFGGTDTNVLTWRRSRNHQREWDAWFTTYDERSDSIAAPVHLATDAVEIAVASDTGHLLWAISNREWPDPVVQLLEWDNANSVARLVRNTRYRGLFGLTILPRHLVLIAAESAASPRDPGVVSVIETHTWRCP